MTHNPYASITLADRTKQLVTKETRPNHELSFVDGDRRAKHTDTDVEDEDDRAEVQANGTKTTLSTALESSDAINKEAKNESSPCKLENMMRLIERSKLDQSKREKDNTMMQIRQMVHELEVCDGLSVNLIERWKIIQTGGLPDIIESEAYPLDVRMDSFSLCKKWRTGRIDNDLFRGIIVQQRADEKPRFELDQRYAHRVSCDYRGEGQLVVGQWWPYQICSLRDGGHGLMCGGVYGQTGHGVYSILLGRQRFPKEFQNVDHGDEVEYCGRVGQDGVLSWSTKILLESTGKNHAIRVFRSSTLSGRSKYRPERGIRYDGLYRIVSARRVQKNTEVYIFSLQRIEGQIAIRWCGEEKRPTREQLATFEHVYPALTQTHSREATAGPMFSHVSFVS